MNVECYEDDGVEEDSPFVDDCVREAANDFQHGDNTRTVVVEWQRSRVVGIVVRTDEEDFIARRSPILPVKSDDDIFPYEGNKNY